MQSEAADKLKSYKLYDGWYCSVLHFHASLNDLDSRSVGCVKAKKDVWANEVKKKKNFF